MTLFQKGGPVSPEKHEHNTIRSNPPAERKIVAMAEVLRQFAGYVEKAHPRVIPAFSITRLD